MRAWCTLAVQGFRFLHLRISTIFRLFIVLLANWPFLWLIAMSWVFMNDFIIKISRSLSRSLADCVIKLGFFHSWSFSKNKKANCIKNKKPKTVCTVVPLRLIWFATLNWMLSFYFIPFCFHPFDFLIFFSSLSRGENASTTKDFEQTNRDEKKKQKQRNN